MPAFIYRCPASGYNVQGFVADDPTNVSEDVFQPVTCTVCAGVHLVNPKTGRLLEIDGQREGDNV
jgi:hypothetical protein